MAVRHTRVLRGRLRAEVGLGTAIGGYQVDVTVDLDLLDPDVKKAVDNLHKVIEAKAMDRVTEAMADREKWLIKPDKNRRKNRRKAQ